MLACGIVKRILGFDMQSRKLRRVEMRAGMLAVCSIGVDARRVAKGDASATNQPYDGRLLSLRTNCDAHITIHLRTCLEPFF